MAKTKISEFDTDPSLNTDIDSINIAEGCAPSGINNAIRELMSQLKNQQDGSSLDTFTVGNTLTINAANSLRLADTDSSHYVGLKSPTAVTTSYTLTLPTADGTSGQALSTNGSGTLAFGTLSVLAGGTGVTTSTGTGNVVLSTSPTLVTPVLGTPSSGTLSSCTVDGTNEVGYKNIPQNSQSAAYTLVLADAGKHIFHPSGDANARTFTIPANSSVAYPIGTAITFINMTSQVVTIAITTDTMYLSSAGTTGSRSLAQYGSATAIKMTSTTWLISGSGLT